ncbi:toprim domain-containing protein [Candidatus Micrarchaeota archaeon]|nr:toprim domain-containing protein [Candidatus Micrarchaeota archaeon]
MQKALVELSEIYVLVEGQKDKQALEKIGIAKVLTISGNLRISVEKLQALGVSKVAILTDMDRRGFEQAKAAKEELEGASISADLEMRTIFARNLRLKFFEDIERKFEELKNEVEHYGENIH